MKCDCITKVNEKLRENFDDEKAEVSVALCLDNNVLDAYPALTATYHKKKKDGTYADKKTEVSLRPSYCPFCGIKYEVGEKDEG